MRKLKIVLWVFRKLKIVLWVFALSPLVMLSINYYGLYYVYPQKKGILDNGVEAVAIIEGGKRTERRGQTTSVINLTWRDSAGEIRRAERVVITEGVADKIVKGNVLIAELPRIKYLESDTTVKPLVLADLPPSGPVPVDMSDVAIFLLPMSLIGVGGLYFLRRRNAS